MFEPVYRSRPGADAMRPAAAERAEQIAPGLWCSPGLSNSYLLTTADGRVVVNTGMGFEGPVHRANFDAVDCSPVRYIILTQGHVDHVGGLDSVRDPETKVVAQANWTLWRDDNERPIPYRASRSAFAFKDTLSAGIQAIQRRLGTTRLAGQSVPNVDLDFADTLVLEVGGRRMELVSVPGGRNDRLVGGLAAGGTNMSVRKYLWSAIRPHPQPRHHAWRPVPRRAGCHRLDRAGGRAAPRNSGDRSF